MSRRFKSGYCEILFDEFTGRKETIEIICFSQFLQSSEPIKSRRVKTLIEFPFLFPGRPRPLRSGLSDLQHCSCWARWWCSKNISYHSTRLHQATPGWTQSWGGDIFLRRPAWWRWLGHNTLWLYCAHSRSAMLNTIMLHKTITPPLYQLYFWHVPPIIWVHFVHIIYKILSAVLLYHELRCTKGFLKWERGVL